MLMIGRLVLFLVLAMVAPGATPAAKSPCPASPIPVFSLDGELQDRILKLDPEAVTPTVISNVLACAPAPRIVNLHGGRYPVFRYMVSFSDFLAGMGYPRQSLTNPADGTYSFSGYDSAKKIAGVIAWYYERDGLRPMLVGHSLGGFQVVKVLHLLAGPPERRIPVWNVLRGQRESRCEISDPLDGQTRPVVGLCLPFASSVGSGGLTRMMPNQWDMMFRLRDIPDTVEEFTGFYIGLDLLGGDLLGFGPSNHYKARNAAVVRNVRLPTASNHGTTPDTRHLLRNPAATEWIAAYHPLHPPAWREDLDRDKAHILWVAEVWYGIRKHWVLELQRAIKARRAHLHG